MKSSAKFKWIKPIPNNAKQAKTIALKVLKTQMVKDMSYYVPYDTHALQNSGTQYVATHLDDNYIIYGGGRVPYARRMYYWTGKFHKNANAKREWAKYAKTVCMDRWLRLAKAKYMEVLKK